MTIEDLPHHLECREDDCELPHFLSINRCLNGNWSAGYVAWGEAGELVIPQLFINEAETLTEIAVRLEPKVKRYTFNTPEDIKGKS